MSLIYDASTSELIVAVGGLISNNKKTEILDVDGDNWSLADDYPFDWGLTYFLFLWVTQSIPGLRQRIYQYRPDRPRQRLVLLVWWILWSTWEDNWSTRHKNAQMDQCRQSLGWSERTQCNLRRPIRARRWRIRNIQNREVLNFKRASQLFQPIAGVN